MNPSHQIMIYEILNSLIRRRKILNMSLSSINSLRGWIKDLANGDLILIWFVLLWDQFNFHSFESRLSHIFQVLWFLYFLVESWRNFVLIQGAFFGFIFWESKTIDWEVFFLMPKKLLQSYILSWFPNFNQYILWARNWKNSNHKMGVSLCQTRGHTCTSYLRTIKF